MSVMLNWTYTHNVAHPEDGFIIQRREVGGGFVEIDRVGPHTFSYTDMAALEGHNYEWKVLVNFADQTMEEVAHTTISMPHEEAVPGQVHVVQDERIFPPLVSPRMEMTDEDVVHTHRVPVNASAQPENPMAHGMTSVLPFEDEPIHGVVVEAPPVVPPLQSVPVLSDEGVLVSHKLSPVEKERVAKGEMSFDDPLQVVHPHVYGAMHFDWTYVHDPMNPEDGFRVQRREVGTVDWTDIGHIDKDVFMFVDETFDENRAYEWRVMVDFHDHTTAEVHDVTRF